MLASNLSRRRCLRSAMLGGGAVLAGGLSGRLDEQADAQEQQKPSGLTITKVETLPLRHQMKRPMGVSTALSDVRTCLLVKISTDSGLVGWGETIDVGGTRAVIETKHKPALLGKNPLEHRKLWRALW